LNVTLIVLDLETTGLNPNADDILEVGAIVLDQNERAAGKFSALTQRWKPFHEIPSVVREMHTRNGLWAALQVMKERGAERTIRHVDWQLSDFLREHGVKEGSGVLVGYSIDFDRRFIRAQMPQTEIMLGHRMRDVSALSKTLKGWGLATPSFPEPPHRALLDCEQELAEYQAIREYLCSK
jgi:oligoribonuclease